MLRAHSRLFEQLTLVADLVLIGACWLAAYGLRFYVLGPPLVNPQPPPLRDYLLQLVPILVVWGVAFRWFDLYRPRRLGSHFSEWVDVAKASTLGVLVLVAIMTFVFRRTEYSRVVMIYFWVLSTVAVSLWRATFREALRVARRAGRNQRRAIVVGGGGPATEIAAALRRRPDAGVALLGVVGDKTRAGETGAPWLGGFEDLRALLDRHQVELVFVALTHDEYGRLPGVLADIGDDPVTIHLVPDVFSLGTLGGGVEEFEGVPIVYLRESPLHGWNLVLKRVLDLAAGAAALVLTAPLLAVLAVAVKLSSPGPVLLRQERMGLDGHRFGMLKFRTMRADAEVATGPVWASAEDPRRTRLGAVLRAWSLDELPQLFNVLRGDMSLVGPRPERPVFVEDFRRRLPGYMLRHKVKAGMTGWAQINGWRGNSSLEKRLEYDLYYIERWSLAFDLKILAQTLWRGFVDKNAY
ncbi:MAG: undecaprenyl-phosphate glucose phosphotransferase [Candidatus Rokubacteria bacterium]|nr:undecaprenyl-phosphate glucose phosphotransferase [Candidatus Rokubacteria bacterium]MBI3825284.1 undecaprenyl-phosphate glucose phosphotransferase [Candidatus Rokubacteria bacterium]